MIRLGSLGLLSFPYINSSSILFFKSGLISGRFETYKVSITLPKRERGLYSSRLFFFYISMLYRLISFMFGGFPERNLVPSLDID
jgi:hypothetical protein